MIEVKEVKPPRQKREFVKFPLKLYKNNPCFVPPLYGDEKKIFSPDYVYYDTCEAVYYNAYRDGVMVGRISGILQKASNQKHNEKRVRFTRFDSINDVEVARALFDAVEAWGSSLGMDTICGPLGFSDLEREGLLIEGFDELATFEEQYNADYYPQLIEALGYRKEVDWIERKIYAPDEGDNTLEKMADFIRRRYHLSVASAKNISDFLRRYGDDMFALLDKTYAHLYGTVPFTDRMKKMVLDNFKLVIKLKYVAAITDENGKVVCFGLCLPSLARAVQPTGGRLTPLALVRLLHAINHPRILDLALVGVDPDYANRGISVLLTSELARMLRQNEVEYAETNLCLEDNFAIQNEWKRFNAQIHKRRRSYIKELKKEENPSL